MEPDYEVFNTICEKIDETGGNYSTYYKKKIIDEEIYKFNINFTCYEYGNICKYDNLSIKKLWNKLIVISDFVVGENNNNLLSQYLNIISKSDNNESICNDEIIDYYYLNKTCVEECPINYRNDSNKNCILQIFEECSNNKFLLKLNNICVDNCNFYSPFIYLYQNECVDQCPLGTHINSYNICIEDIAEDKEDINVSNDIKEDTIGVKTQDFIEYYEDCPIKYPYILLENRKCIGKCNPIDFFKKKCDFQNNTPIIINEMINNIKSEILNGSMDSLILENFPEWLKKRNDLIFSIISENGQDINKNTNISVVKFNECKSILRDIYNISQNDSLVILN